MSETRLTLCEQQRRLEMSSLAVASSTVHTYTTRGGSDYFLYCEV